MEAFEVSKHLRNSIDLIKEYIDDEEVYKPYVEAMNIAIDYYHDPSGCYAEEVGQDIFDEAMETQEPEDMERFIEEMSASSGDYVGNEIYYHAIGLLEEYKGEEDE